MVVEVRSTPSRRAILAGLIGGLAATAATAIERAQPVAAHDPDDLQLGINNATTASTGITNSVVNHTAFEAVASGAGTGVIGSAGNGGTGVQGDASSSTGTGIGVWGIAGSGKGVEGEAGSGTGVYGIAFSGGIGVDGFSDSYIGVRGTSTSDIGVIGVSGSSFGVRGSSTSGDGVHGYSPTGNGVLAQTLGGYAIKADGRLNFSRASGVASIPAGSTSHTWEPLVDITAASFVLLTPMANIGTRALWFTKNTTSGTITIHLSSSRTSATKISWLLLG